MSWLDEMESEAQLRAVLKSGDKDLERDIRKAIEEKIDNDRAHGTAEWEMMEPDELVDAVMCDGDNLGSLVGALDADDALIDVPRERVSQAVRDEVVLAAEEALSRVNQGRGGSRLMSFETGQGGGVTVRPVYEELIVSFDDAPLSWLTEEDRLRFLKEADYHDSDWEAISDDDYSSGWVETGDSWRIVPKHGNTYEFALDIRQDYFSEMADADPDEAIKAFLTIIDRLYPKLAKQLRKAKLPKDVLADYSVLYFTEPEDGLENLQEAMGRFGYEGSRGEVILEVDRDVLRGLGITQGRWWDGAPWRLLNLPAEELAYEGTVMRHCVGRRSMGYRDAVLDGEIWIWSLRSDFGKPILTFEVDRPRWTQFPTSPLRGQAIRQLKGRCDRPSGNTADEARVLYWIFARLGVVPNRVSDFIGDRYLEPDDRPASNPARSFRRSWQPSADQHEATKDKLLAFNPPRLDRRRGR